MLYEVITRIEVARALHSGKPVVPVLIDDVPMPEPAQLPEPLAGLARRHAVRLTDAGWHDDVARLEKTVITSYSIHYTKLYEPRW